MTYDIEIQKKWRINRFQTASLDIHAQNCFTPLCPDELPVPDGHHIVKPLNDQAQYANLRIATKDAHCESAEWVATEDKAILTPISEADNMDCHWPKHAVPGTKGFEMIEGLPKVTDYDFVVWQGIEPDMHPYGACFHDYRKKLSTGLIEFLQNYRISTVIVGGLTIEYCIKETVDQLLYAGFQVVVNLSACRALEKRGGQQALNEMSNLGAFFVEDVNAFELCEKRYHYEEML